MDRGVVAAPPAHAPAIALHEQDSGALGVRRVRREDEVESSKFCFETADTEYAQLFFDRNEREGWQTLARCSAQKASTCRSICRFKCG